MTNGMLGKTHAKVSMRLRCSLYLCLLLVLYGCSPRPTNTLKKSFIESYRSFDYCRLTVTKQTECYSCGIACIASVIKYWGKHVSEKQLLEEFPSSPKRGYWIRDLKRIAANKGLEAFVITMQRNPKESLHEQIFKGRPVICAINWPKGLYVGYDIPLYGPLYRYLLWEIGPRGDHYVVAFGVTDNKVLLMDPAFGFIDYDWKRFEECWSSLNFAALVCAKKAEKSDPGYSRILEREK